MATASSCVDAQTGRVVWHYQLIHHDIWDWDNPTAPILMDLVVDGRPIKAVAQITKQAWVYTFDRVTGEPVWPIEERPVPASDVPGESTSPTQPFPTKPPPFDRQGLVEDDLIDFTPALRAEAVEGTKVFRLGPIFTPPSLANAADGTSGTLMLPHATGGANWEGGAFDPETNVLYVGSFTNPFIAALEPPPAASGIRYISGGARADSVAPGAAPREAAVGQNHRDRHEQRRASLAAAQWADAEGDRRASGACGARYPPTGRATRPVTLVTKTLLFTAEGWGGSPVLHARDKATGEVLAEIQLPGAVGGRPMTYAIDGRQFIVMPVAGNRGARARRARTAAVSGGSGTVPDPVPDTVPDPRAEQFACKRREQHHEIGTWERALAQTGFISARAAALGHRRILPRGLQRTRTYARERRACSLAGRCTGVRRQRGGRDRGTQRADRARVMGL